MSRGGKRVGAGRPVSDAPRRAIEIGTHRVTIPVTALPDDLTAAIIDLAEFKATR